MINPVCNETGNSYSKNGYIEYLRQNGKVDPVTKKPLTSPIMYTNINLKKAIEAFLEKNPWAFDEKVWKKLYIIFEYFWLEIHQWIDSKKTKL